MKIHWIESLIIAIGLAAFGFFVMQGLNTFAAKDRSVVVKGLAEMEVNANKVTWPLTYKEVSNDLKELYQNINQKNEIIKKFLIDNQIPEADISVNPPYIVDLQAERYNSNPIIYRYNADAGLTVTTDKVDLVPRLLREQVKLLDQGIAISSSEYSINYQYTELNSIKPQMIEEATKNARLAADKFAQDSGSKIGKIQNAHQGQFSIENRDENTPYIKKVRVVTTINYALED